MTKLIGAGSVSDGNHPSLTLPAPISGETQFTLTPLTERTVAVTPYPFDRSPLPFAVRAHLTPDRDYGSDDEFRAVFAAAPRMELHFEVCARG